MPLDTHTSAPSPLHTPHYLIFFSSGTPPWCPDCIDALPTLQRVFSHDPATNHNVATLLLVGQRHEWKTPENKFRKQYGITSIPTILKIVDGKEVGRLDDTESKSFEKVAAFVA